MSIRTFPEQDSLTYHKLCRIKESPQDLVIIGGSLVPLRKGYTTMAKAPSGGKPPPKREIIDARADGDGDITHVKFKGNSRFTPVGQAIPMADRGEIKTTHVVHPTAGRQAHTRTNADGTRLKKP